MKEQETIKTSIVREAAMMLARMWAQHIRPVSYDRVFYVDGVRVRIVIDEYKSKQDTKPLQESEIEALTSDRSSEA
jgi:hypothetical protein